ncbi:MAG: cold shock domain-containing protein [Bdellovibrionota bacterium]
MPTGIIEQFSRGRGFGILQEEKTGQRYYVIFDAIEGGRDFLEPGQKVEFEPGKRGEADVALKVRPR